MPSNELSLRKHNLWSMVPYMLLANVLVTFAIAQVQVVSGLTEIKSALPGERVTFTAQVANMTTEPQRIDVALADYEIRASEDLFLAPGTNARSLARWAHHPRDVIIPPGETHVLIVTVDVPAGQDLMGTYWALLLITPETSYPLPINSALGGDAAAGASVQFRYRNRTAVQLVLELPGQAAPALQIDHPQLAHSATGGFQLSVEIRNVGDRWTDQARLAVDLYDATTGASIHSHNERTARIYPGSSQRLTFDLGVLPASTYHLVAIADARLAQPAAVRYTINLEPQDPEDQQAP